MSDDGTTNIGSVRELDDLLASPAGGAPAPEMGAVSLARGVLDAVPYRRLPEILARLVARVRPNGGRVELSVGDFDWIARQTVSGEADDLYALVCGPQQEGESDTHRSIFTRTQLVALLRQAGLRSVRCEADGKGALVASGTRRGEAGLDVATGGHTPGVIAIISLPRLAFTANWTSTFCALSPLKVPMRHYTGAFWEQGISRLLYPIVDQAQAKYVLTVDYDSVYESADVLALLELAEDHPEAAAIFPCQIRRDADHPIVGFRDGAGKWRADLTVGDFVADLTPADFGHFGLTLLRVDALRALPHPWFHSQPNAQGRWGEGKVDADIYFWLKLKEHGMAAYMANHVRIWHAQQMYSGLDEHMRPVHVYPGDYDAQRGNRP